MSQKFYKGRTQNHATWPMVDATDGLTRESALSAATVITIYGKVRGSSAVFTVAGPGTGSLSQDIKHVGPSVLGLYTIGLLKADLSDASNAWYDQYIITLSGTGAALQTLIFDGGIDDSNLSAIVSDLTSALAIANSRILLNLSRISDIASVQTLHTSTLSDIASAVLLVQSMASDAASAATQANSRVLLNQSRISDIQSFLSDFQSDLLSLVTVTGVQLNASTMSDIRSAIGEVSVVLDASNISDIASAVVAAIPFASQISDIYSLTQRIDSRVLVNQSYLSHLSAVLSDFQSDFGSRVPKLVATNSQVSDLLSDVRSVQILHSSTLSDIQSFLSNLQSGLADASDIASAVWAENAVASQVLLILSRVSDVQSFLSDFKSNTDSFLSNFHSDMTSLITTTGVNLNASVMSDLRSAIAAVTVVLDASNISDIASAVVAAIPFGSQISDILSAVTVMQSRVLLIQSNVSDIGSNLSDFKSDFQSRVPTVVATRSLLSDVESNLRSMLVLNASSVSDVQSLLTRVDSRVLVAQSAISDFRSQVTAGVTLTAAGYDAIWDEPRAGHTTQGTFGESYNGIVSFTVGAGSTTTNIETNLTEATNDHYNGRTLVFITGALAGQATSISDYSGAGKSLTVVALTEAPANGDRAVIV